MQRLLANTTRFSEAAIKPIAGNGTTCVVRREQHDGPMVPGRSLE